MTTADDLRSMSKRSVRRVIALARRCLPFAWHTNSRRVNLAMRERGIQGERGDDLQQACLSSHRRVAQHRAPPLLCVVVFLGAMIVPGRFTNVGSVPSTHAVPLTQP